MDIRNNNLKYLKKKYTEDLRANYGQREAEQLLTILIEHFFGFDRNSLLLNPETRLSESEILKLHMAVKRLKNNEPVQYITGNVEFLNMIFLVNPDVLIPRPETEYMVDLIVKKETESGIRVLDIGTGSGCIAVSLAALLINADVTAVDISYKAVETARINVAQNNQKVDVVEMDILDSKSSYAFAEKFDIIVSNPPYVTISDKAQMNANVIEYEPHLALFVSDEEALKYYKAIIDFALDNLKVGGRMYLEINENKGNDVAELLSASGIFEKVEVVADLTGRARFVFGV